MRIWLGMCCLLFGVTLAQANENFALPLDSGEEVAVNVYPATFKTANKPLIIWFTEGYASRKPFQHIISLFNDEGYDLWQVDLLESYFMQRTPTNVRSLQGEGVAAVLKHASDSGQKFVPISTGRMSLIVLRGSRLWQLNTQPKDGIGGLQQVVSFFPNWFDAPQKAGDSPSLFPIVSATSLPMTIVQPTQGAFKWKLPQMIHALESNHSQVSLVAVPNARDWYFLKPDQSDLERTAGEQIPERLALWLKAAKMADNSQFKTLAKLPVKQATVSMKGLVKINARPASNFSLTDIKGQLIQLKDKQGKVILLNFWASWCAPCVKEIPSMNRLAKAFNEDEFEIVSVNFKESPQAINAFLKRVQVDFPVLMDLDGKIANQFETFAFPSSFILDKNGQIQYSVNAAMEWDEPQVKQLIQTMVQQ